MKRDIEMQDYSIEDHNKQHTLQYPVFIQRDGVFLICIRMYMYIYIQYMYVYTYILYIHKYKNKCRQSESTTNKEANSVLMVGQNQTNTCFR